MTSEAILDRRPHPLWVGALPGEPLRSILQLAEPAIDKLFALDPLRDLHRASRTPEDLLRNLRRVPADLGDLSALIAGLERDGKGVPILMRQYLKTGRRLLCLNVDRHFSSVLDALIMVDLSTAPVPLLDRYMGKTRGAEFRPWHAARA